jgi:hypothetical protein
MSDRLTPEQVVQLELQEREIRTLAVGQLSILMERARPAVWSVAERLAGNRGLEWSASQGLHDREPALLHTTSDVNLEIPDPLAHERV